MDSWRKAELDKLTCGEVALQVFGVEQELEEAAEARAKAYVKMTEAQSALDRATEEVRSASDNERYCSNEYKALKKYLNERLFKA